MQIHERIHIVGSGTDGIGISNEYDCTVYLLDGGGEYALIDAGLGLDSERILKNIENTGINRTQITSVFLTHGHGDHSGGAAALGKACQAEVYALKETAEYVTEGNLDAISLKEAVQAGVYGKEYVYQACPVHPLADDEERKVGDMVVHTYRTEGHCSGHACYGVDYQGKRILFSGDTVFNYGRISMQSIWDCDLQKYLATCQKLEDLHPDILLPSHGAFLMEKGYTYIEKAMKAIRLLGIPKNIIGE